MASISGLALARAFFHDAVKVILERHFPRLSYAAALLGEGSEVLGFDDEASRDHHWGPRLLVFLEKVDHMAIAEHAKKILADELPLEFMGYPTSWTAPDAYHVQLLTPTATHPVNHRVEFHTVDEYLKDRLGLEHRDLSMADWFIIPEQALLEFTSGEVFHDAAGTLTRARQEMAFYPDNVWRALLASEWSMIAEESAFTGRTGQRGDEIGSMIVAGRQIKRLMRVAFLISRQYAPYPKWFGVAFKKLPISRRLEPVLLKCLVVRDWRARERLLADGCALLVEEMARNDIIHSIPVAIKGYHDRDQVVADVEPVIACLLKDLDESLIKIAAMGSTSQLIDESRQFMLNGQEYRSIFKHIYDERQ